MRPPIADHFGKVYLHVLRQYIFLTIRNSKGKNSNWVQISITWALAFCLDRSPWILEHRLGLSSTMLHKLKEMDGELQLGKTNTDNRCVWSLEIILFWTEVGRWMVAQMWTNTYIHTLMPLKVMCFLSKWAFVYVIPRNQCSPVEKEHFKSNVCVLHLQNMHVSTYLLIMHSSVCMRALTS